MLFSSVIFLFLFLPIVMLLYYTVGRRSIVIRNTILLIASLLFYAWGEPKNIILLVLSCVMNYLFGLFVGNERFSLLIRRGFLAVAVVFNLGMLFCYKYVDFTFQTINTFFQREVLPLPGIALPIGISFFTFQAMSYVIDVYRKDTPVQKNPFLVMLYVSLFPQLVAGPIVRYHEVQEQLLTRQENREDVCQGMLRFVFGMCKKILLANAMGAIADNVYGVTNLWHTQYLVPASLAWLGSIAYTLQIYLDFSAYSDMAIGLGAMFGFHFGENFRYPYISDSITEFWKRWHISLTSWFREYLYFPLGGSRVENMDLMVRNLAIIWLCTGIWHGANWTFILWGMWNLLFVLLERLTNLDKSKSKGAWWRHLYLLLIVNFGWVLFRSENIHVALEFFRNMFLLNGNGFASDITWMFLRENWLWFILSIGASIPQESRMALLPSYMQKKQWPLPSLRLLYPVAVALMFMVCVFYLVRSEYNPFIYFNF